VIDRLPLEGRQVLVVEDQYLLARDVCEWLEAAGAHVVGPAPDSTKACELLEGHAVDSAVVDINLGRGPTYEVAARLNEREVPFLFATGYDEEVIPAEFQGAARLEKPFTGADLVQAVEALRLS
jgi:CheY-like chemotaxis protein